MWVMCVGEMQPINPVSTLMAKAISLAGSEAKLARAMGYSQNAVWSAKRRGRVSAEMATAVDRATRGAVPREALRPDLFSGTQNEIIFRGSP